MTDFPLYYGINDFKASLIHARPIDHVSTANVMDMINAIRHEGRDIIAIVLNKQGWEYTHGLGDFLPFREPYLDTVTKPDGYIGEWFNIPLFSDYVPGKELLHSLSKSYIFTGIEGVMTLAEVPKELVTHVDPLPEVNVPPHSIDPFYDHTLDKPTLAYTAQYKALEERLKSLILAELRSQFKGAILQFTDVNGDTQVFQVQPLLESLLREISSLTGVQPTAIVTTTSIPEAVVIPDTLTAVPIIPHHAQNLDQLNTELAYWTNKVKSGDLEAIKKQLSCQQWIVRRQAENVADSPQL